MAYAGTFGVPFLFDDVPAILENSAIKAWWPPSRFVGSLRPVAAYTFALNWALHGEQVWGYHAVNLAIHLTAGLLLFGTVRRTLMRQPLAGRFAAHAGPLALTIALVWVVHPLQTQAVTYIVQRFESLMALAYLATLHGLSLPGNALLLHSSAGCPPSALLVFRIRGSVFVRHGLQRSHGHGAACRALVRPRAGNIVMA
jgi:hypothetical protein